MTENLEQILGEDPGQEPKKQGFWSKAKNYYRGKIGSLRPYIASLGALSIGVANWSKDFGYDTRVGLPFFYTNLSIGGHQWYDLALLQESATMISLAATAKDRAKATAYALAYEAGSAINTVAYYMAFSNPVANEYYGRLWNAVFYVYQLPVFFLMLRKYFGKNKEKPEAAKD